MAGFDAAKQSGLAVVADAREALGELGRALEGYRAPSEWSRLAGEQSAAWAGAAKVNDGMRA